MARLTMDRALYLLYWTLKNNAPVRSTPGKCGKKGTNMYSPYPGNLKNNGIYIGYKAIDRGSVVLSGVDGKVGYLPYTETKSKSPGWQEKSIKQFIDKLCVNYGGRRI